MKTVLFDLNGVIINDERFHQQSWREFSKEHGFELTEEQFTHQIFGRTEKDTLNFLFGKSLSNEEISKYSDQRVDFVINLVSPFLELTEGFSSFLELLSKRGVVCGIGTSSRKRYVNFIIERFNLKEFFPVIVTAEDVVNGKPDPEVYLKAAQLLGSEPSSCIVIEDSLSGIKAAQAAGMKAIGITTTHTAQELYGADCIVSHFDEIKTLFINKNL